jgi:oxygen-independent coproporphyrinogen-3 oxidase
MSGLPEQDEKTLNKDIETACSYVPGHISLYALTLEQGTSLKGIPSAETADKLWLAGRDALLKEGYGQYEVSNFARDPSCRCIHNIRYWQLKNWIGIGPAASGTIIENNCKGRRIGYAPRIEDFLNAVKNSKVPPLVIENLDRTTALKETLLMGYRYCEGPDPALFVRRFGKPVEEVIPQTLAKWQDRAGNGSMPETIMNFLNPFLLDAFLELDNDLVK